MVAPDAYLPHYVSAIHDPILLIKDQDGKSFYLPEWSCHTKRERYIRRLKESRSPRPLGDYITRNPSGAD